MLDKFFNYCDGKSEGFQYLMAFVLLLLGLCCLGLFIVTLVLIASKFGSAFVATFIVTSMILFILYHFIKAQYN